MDGFGALKAMLKLTHPTLTMKHRPSNAPILSETSDIHTYEQSLKNFFLLHKLFNNQSYSSLEKAKQFIAGIDDTQYDDAVTRITHQLDTVQTMNVPLHEDYTIENLTSTIINITNEYDNSKTIVRAMQKRSSHRDTFKSNPYQSNERTHVYKPRRITKAQCHACKQYGHIVTHCTLLPKVLAVNQFMKKNTDKCEALLRQHIHNNSVESKKTFVRTLQGINVLPEEGDSDENMENDIIINIMMDNAINPDDIVLSDE